MSAGMCEPKEDSTPYENKRYEHMLMVQVLLTARAVRAEFGHFVGMMPTRWGILGAFSQTDELSQALLEERLMVDGAVITRQVKTLEKEGLVVRRSDPKDNRFTLVSLTEQGRQVQTELVTKSDLFDAQLLAELSTSDLEILFTLLHRIRANAIAANLHTQDKR